MCERLWSLSLSLAHWPSVVREGETIGGVPYHAESTLSSAQVLKCTVGAWLVGAAITTASPLFGPDNDTRAILSAATLLFYFVRTLGSSQVISSGISPSGPRPS